MPRGYSEGGEFGLEDWVNGKIAPHFSGSHKKAKKKNEVSWEAAIGSIGSGLAFIIISIVLAYQPMGFGWWFWLLIPGFGALGVGIAQVIRLRQLERENASSSKRSDERELPGSEREALPHSRTVFAEEEVKIPKRTGDFATPSVTEETTRHLELDNEGETSKLEEID